MVAAEALARPRSSGIVVSPGREGAETSDDEEVDAADESRGVMALAALASAPPPAPAPRRRGLGVCVGA